MCVWTMVFFAACVACCLVDGDKPLVRYTSLVAVYMHACWIYCLAWPWFTWMCTVWNPLLHRIGNTSCIQEHTAFVSGELLWNTFLSLDQNFKREGRRRKWGEGVGGSDFGGELVLVILKTVSISDFIIREDVLHWFVYEWIILVQFHCSTMYV